jgi:quinol monooxygenase YgiN
MGRRSFADLRGKELLSPDPKSVVIIGHFRLPVESMDAAREPMARVVAATRNEPGCIKYAYAPDPADPGLIHVSEVWESAKRSMRTSPRRT